VASLETAFPDLKGVKIKLSCKEKFLTCLLALLTAAVLVVFVMEMIAVAGSI
jgi:hypothetical protein